MTQKEIDKFLSNTKVYVDMCNVIGSYNVDWYWRGSTYYHVILWSPLPELPKE